MSRAFGLPYHLHPHSNLNSYLIYILHSPCVYNITLYSLLALSNLSRISSHTAKTYKVSHADFHYQATPQPLSMMHEFPASSGYLFPLLITQPISISRYPPPLLAANPRAAARHDARRLVLRIPSNNTRKSLFSCTFFFKHSQEYNENLSTILVCIIVESASGSAVSHRDVDNFGVSERGVCGHKRMLRWREN
ncbi:hypothetical protein BDP27DRAFT_1323443 [Rhodocollybia butyracea]|uniref:Uncharacterized protein n=1 Tax=Rhodocollybia butyracea TaxID=206335 RepID=A0A9P5PWG7_9AGAR|nr:hypothetical protein BDP27DRAFT_1323443 [Rhodocollybia butyracea]